MLENQTRDIRVWKMRCKLGLLKVRGVGFTHEFTSKNTPQICLARVRTYPGYPNNYNSAVFCYGV